MVVDSCLILVLQQIRIYMFIHPACPGVCSKMQDGREMLLTRNLLQLFFFMVQSMSELPIQKDDNIFSSVLFYGNHWIPQRKNSLLCFDPSTGRSGVSVSSRTLSQISSDWAFTKDANCMFFFRLLTEHYTVLCQPCLQIQITSLL